MGANQALTKPPQSEAIVASTPMELLSVAVSQNADIEKLARLMELQERWEKNEARKAFVAAMAEFKANPPTLTKNKRVAFKDVKYSYAPLDQVAALIGSALSKHGLSHRWATEQKDSLISVTCILQHVAGHSESVTLQGLPDTTGSKNSVQAIGSTVTYLERYTLLAATGLAAQDADNDGIGAAKMADLEERLEWIRNCRTQEELKKVFFQAYGDAAKLRDGDAMAKLTEAKDARRKEL